MKVDTLMHHVAGIPVLAGPTYRAVSELHAADTVDLETFAQWLRGQPFAFDACDLSQLPGDLLRQSFDAAMAVGAHSIPLGVAVAMHLYMLGAMATYPLDNRLARSRREAMLKQVLEQRWLVANSGSDTEVRSADSGPASMTAEFTAGGVRIAGRKTFVSMATVADLLVFTASDRTSGIPISLFTPLRGMGGIRLEDSPFPEFLSETGTRSIVIDRVMLPLDNIISGGANVAFCNAHAYQRMWFCALIPAVYLGAAAAAMSEARAFARTNAANRAPLADFDGVAVEFGRLALTLGAGFQGFEAVCRHLAEASRSSNTDGTDQAADVAAAFKYTAMRAVSEVATSLRRFVGTRAMMPGSKLLRFSQESMFGPLHPELEPLMERRLGRKYLQSA